MKRFFQKSYSWLATLLLMVAFAVSGNASAKSVEITVGANQSITQGDISTYAAYWTGSQVNLYGDLDSEWGYLDVTSFAGAITKVEFYGASEMNTVTCLTGTVSGTSTVGVWEGSEQKVRFHSSSDIYVDKIVVYYEEGGAKECTVDVDHYADNCKPGKHEAPFTKYITLYMQENAATTLWTGSDNCPAEVTLTNEAGQHFRVAQFNTWATSEQLGIQFENEISTPGVYTLHIPEGLVAFENGKFNKEINVTWTVVEPDNRPTKDVVFDFTDGTYTNDGTLSYTKDGVVFTINENRYNATAQGFRIGTDGWVSFAAPEKATLKKIQLLQESSYGVSPDFIPSVGEVSVYDKTLNWTGDDANVTLTDNYGTCYFTKAIVTLAVEESEQPEVDPAETAFFAWKALVMNEMKAVKDEWVDYPEVDVPGKKPANVVKAVMQYYDNTNWLFGTMGFGDDWALAQSYYANYGTTIEANYAEAQQIWAAYVNAELVPEVVEPTYTEPVLKAEDVSAEVAYYIYTDARGGLTVDGDQLKGTNEVGKDVDPTDVSQQFAFVNWNDNLYLYSLAAEKFIGKANRGNFTEEPVDPIYFKNEDESTVMLYFDDNFNFNLGGSKQVTIDTWSKKDDGNSFKIMVAEKFDQTALLDKLANGGGEVVDPVVPVDLNVFAGEWYFKGEGAYCNSPENISGELNPKSEYTVNVEVKNGEIFMTGLIGDVYDWPFAYYGYYDAEANTLRFHTNSYIVDPNWEYYLMDQPLVFNVVKDENDNISLVNTTGWDFVYEDWYYSLYACGFTSCTMTREQQAPVEPTTFKGEVTPNLTSVSSLADLEGIELTFVDADQVSVLEEGGDGIYVQNEDGSEFYAIWHPGFGGTYEVNGNVVTLRNFFSDNTDGYFNELPTGKAVLYFEDYGTFDVNNADADWDGYINTFSVAYEGAPVAQPFELAFRNNMVVCENGQKVEANEAGVGADFYLVNEGLTAVGKTATLYKDGNAMSFIMTLVDGTAISFLGGSSLITEPGTYLLEVPEGTYVDAAGNPSIAYYGQWVIIQKDEPVVDPDEACFNDWVALVNGEFANIANEYGNEIPAQDIVGKKPIAVAVPCIEFYVNRAGLAGMGAILGWQVVNGFLNTSYNTTLAEDYAYAKALLEAYNAAEVVTEVVVEPTYVLKAEDVSAEVAYYIYTDARGGLTVDGDQLKGTKEIGKNVDPTDVNQQFAFVNWEGNLYLYSIAAEKFIGKANRGNFTDEPVDPIYFKNAGADNVMLYFDDSFNFNLGGSNQVTIDGWKQKDAGNSFHIMVAEAFDQTGIFEKLAGWNGNILYPETASNLDDLLSYTVEFENAKEVEASGYDVLAAIFDANGDPYAIALANGVFDSFGSVSFDGGKATVNFMKISDLTAAAQTSAKAAAARIGGFMQPEGQASVVFAGKSFKVDGELVYDVLQKNYDLGENGVPTGIDTIATESNDSIYDLNGRRVNSVRSGLYIKNGVKVFMK